MTNTGKRYHRAGCQYLRYSSRPVLLREAVEFGYTPCHVCHPSSGMSQGGCSQQNQEVAWLVHWPPFVRWCSRSPFHTIDHSHSVTCFGEVNGIMSALEPLPIWLHLLVLPLLCARRASSLQPAHLWPLPLCSPKLTQNAANIIFALRQSTMWTDNKLTGVLLRFGTS